MGSREAVIVYLVMLLTINGQDIGRREPIRLGDSVALSLKACFERAPERMAEMLRQHASNTRVTAVGVSCVVETGDPA
jgi:hypothetical protein